MPTFFAQHHLVKEICRARNDTEIVSFLGASPDINWIETIPGCFEAALPNTVTCAWIPESQHLSFNRRKDGRTIEVIHIAVAIALLCGMSDI